MERPVPLDGTGRDFRKHLVDGDTTVAELERVLSGTRADCKPTPGFDPRNTNRDYLRMQQCIDCDEVYPNIYIGDGATAKNKPYLKMLGITHVLNSAHGGNGFGLVNTSKEFYRDANIEFLGLPLVDLPSTNISQFFYTAASFIEDALSSGGKVYVHCYVGVSRSATCVLAFLMIRRGMLAADAIRTVRRNRNVSPNEGFLDQLATLDNQLRRARLS